MGATNALLNTQKKRKRDEYYTSYEDIASELRHYWKDLRGKTVYCNCDHPLRSNFVRYFIDHFRQIGLRRLIATSYSPTAGLLFPSSNSPALFLDYRGNKERIRKLKGNGDFRSGECLSLLDESDVVITNPPFSLFLNLYELLMNTGKKFLIVGSLPQAVGVLLFPDIMQRKVFLGATRKRMKFRTDTMSVKTVGLTCWYQNIKPLRNKKHWTPSAVYREDGYEQLDNFDALNVNKISQIPCDYDGVMAVPISFFYYWNPNQFRLLGVSRSWGYKAKKVYQTQTYIRSDGTEVQTTKCNDNPLIQIPEPLPNGGYYRIDGKFYVACFQRLFIKRVREKQDASNERVVETSEKGQGR